MFIIFLLFLWKGFERRWLEFELFFLGFICFLIVLMKKYYLFIILKIVFWFFFIGLLNFCGFDIKYMFVFFFYVIVIDISVM